MVIYRSQTTKRSKHATSSHCLKSEPRNVVADIVRIVDCLMALFYRTNEDYNRNVKAKIARTKRAREQQLEQHSVSSVSTTTTSSGRSSPSYMTGSVDEHSPLKRGALADRASSEIGNPCKSLPSIPLQK